MVQDAVVALIETIDAAMDGTVTLPTTMFPLHLALILAARQRLGGKAAYWYEWRWANRRWHVGDGEDSERTIPEPSGPGDVSEEAMLEALLSYLPPHLHQTARIAFDETRGDRETRWRNSGVSKVRYRREWALITQRLAAEGLWEADARPAGGSRLSRKRSGPKKRDEVQE